MKHPSNSLCDLWQSLNRIAIREKLHCETAVCDKKKNTAHVHTAQWEFRFSLPKALAVIAGTVLTAAFSLWLWKKCVERKLVARLKKKYFFLPVERLAKEAENKE